MYKPDEPWFGPKVCGWGWRPVRWQGWAVIAGYVAAFTIILGVVKPQHKMVLSESALIVVLIAICWATGGPPGSQNFGKRP